MMRKVIIPILILFALHFSIYGQTIDGQAKKVSVWNAHEFLESGELSYTIDINFSRIVWKSKTEYAEAIEKAEKELQRKPEDLDRVIQYINACQAAGRHELAVRKAEEYLPQIHGEYKDRQDEPAARMLVQATNVTGPREAQITAYETIRPFLELGDAEVETVYAALENREILQDYHLGFRIAEFYQKIYPYEGGLYFKGFLMTLNNSLYSTIPFMISSIHERIGDTERFLLEYYRALEDSIYLDLLDKAVELEPNNYQYLLSSVGYRALVRWFSQLSTIMVEENVNINSVREIFSSLKLDQDKRLMEDLELALQVRPKHDDQIYLAAALFYATTGKIDRAFEYVDKALQIRPDHPEAYNAKVFLQMLGFADKDTPPSAAERQKIENILKRKMERTVVTAYDLYVLSGLRMLALRDGADGPDRERLMKEMEQYALQSLQVEDTAFGRISLGNALLLQNRIGEAIEQYKNAKERISSDLLYAATANLGVAYLLQGKKEAGALEIRDAMELTGNTLYAAPLIEK